ncbi:RHS repeat-associated core domain-containing protein [Pseudomonas sp. GL-RE-26]|uniref:RHS repeat-associated core domain-containing protein n=1 Tax=Pseudomonas sp. GL-RE-26 TaxID=2832390 RepID=UPI001CBEB9CD|nr:RHS repeat-associated core domain-containing protein [Pseudomonas sp. GL-RE-26]
MLTQLRSLLCDYHYDPLDRLTSHAQPNTPAHQRFYCQSRLATEIQGALRNTIFQSGDQVLGQQQRQGDSIDVALLATDQQRSVLQTLRKDNLPQPIAYTPYGHHRAESGLSSLLGFNGERADPVTGHYLLGNGYRAFNPVLMRFNSPDSWSPFGKGGLNAYAYCEGDPVGRIDPTGHVPYFLVKGALDKLKNQGIFVGAVVGGKSSVKKLVSGKELPMPFLGQGSALSKKQLFVESSLEKANKLMQDTPRSPDAEKLEVFAVYLKDSEKVKSGQISTSSVVSQRIAQYDSRFSIPDDQFDKLVFVGAAGPSTAGPVEVVEAVFVQGPKTYYAYTVPAPLSLGMEVKGVAVSVPRVATARVATAIRVGVDFRKTQK